MALTPEIIEKSLTYPGYLELIDALLAEDKSTGPNQSEALTGYSRLNRQRMSRLDKTAKLDEEILTQLADFPEKMIWMVLTEGWCGDAAQNVPVFAKMAEASPNIELKLLLRDEHPEIMDAYLTNGGKAIPKLVALRASDLKELGTWGPRPAPAQAMVMEFKANPTEAYAEFVKKVQLWYAKDKNRTIQAEFKTLLNSWANS